MHVRLELPTPGVVVYQYVFSDVSWFLTFI